MTLSHAAVTLSAAGALYFLDARIATEEGRSKSMVGSIAARAVILVTLVTFAFVPLTAGAQGTSGGPTVYHYSTSITPQYGSSYPIAGHLDLEVFSDGIVRGYYHNAYQKAYVPVTGGRDGNYLWFNIGPTIIDMGFLAGPNGKAHVVATMDDDNSFRGQIYPEGTATGDAAASNFPANNTGSAGLINPTAPPANVVSMEQYIFTAKLIDKSSEDYPGM
jgi:hypothetical protein